MKISYNWLKEYITTNLSPQEMSKVLTDIGLEVEGVEEIETIKGGLKGLIIGEVKEVAQHPNADRLKLTKVFTGKEELPIVCGAPNVAIGQKVVVATVGAELFPSDSEESLKIKKSKIRGEVSEGMLCAEDEIGLGKSHDGIMVLDEAAEVGLSASDYFKVESDYLIEIGLTPNRADAMGHLGVARDLLAYLKIKGEPVELKKPKISEIDYGSNSNLDIQLETEKCPKYLGALLVNVEVKESPDWLKNRLRAIGLSPINNVVDITNFVMHETGQPLHAFDGQKVAGKIKVRQALSAEKFVTLDEEERELHQDDMMIANEQDAMCIAGVFGGSDSGITSVSKEVVLESAYFNPVSVRKSSKRHGLHTDASFRFERGVDPNATEYALSRAIDLIKDLCGGELSGSVVKKGEQTFSPFKVSFSPDRCRQLIGENLEDAFMQKVLDALEIKKTGEQDGVWNLEVPPYRVDVTREADVVEEILRLYGYNAVSIPSKVHATTANFPKKDPHVLKNKISNHLSALGFNEIMNNSLTKHGVGDKESRVAILNPLSMELSHMRTSMVHGVLASIAYNQNRQQADVSLYEFGKLYFKREQGSYDEQQKMALALSGDLVEGNWLQKRPSGFYQLKSYVESILKFCGVSFKQELSDDDSFEEMLLFKHKKRVLAKLGSLSDKTRAAFGVKNSVFYAELDFDHILNLYQTDIAYQAIPKFPSVKRDLSLLIDSAVTFDQISELVRSTNNDLLKKVDLFDVYQGKNLPEGKKSYAISLVLQDHNKTLVDKRVDKLMSNIINKLTKELSAELR